VIKHVHAAELRIVVAAVLAAAAHAVHVAHSIPKLDAYLVTALAGLHVHNRAKKQPEGGKHAREKKVGGRDL
jgi:hypothetical protein